MKKALTLTELISQNIVQVLSRETSNKFNTFYGGRAPNILNYSDWSIIWSYLTSVNPNTGNPLSPNQSNQITILPNGTVRGQGATPSPTVDTSFVPNYGPVEDVGAGTSITAGNPSGSGNWTIDKWGFQSFMYYVIGDLTSNNQTIGLINNNTFVLPNTFNFFYFTYFAEAGPNLPGPPNPSFVMGTWPMNWPNPLPGGNNNPSWPNINYRTRTQRDQFDRDSWIEIGWDLAYDDQDDDRGDDDNEEEEEEPEASDGSGGVASTGSTGTGSVGTGTIGTGGTKTNKGFYQPWMMDPSYYAGPAS